MNDLLAASVDRNEGLVLGENIQLITITFVILTTFVGSILVRIASAETTKNAKSAMH